MVILVVAIPEGLPISVNIAVSFSMQKMLIDKNLVRKIDVIYTNALMVFDIMISCYRDVKLWD